MAKRKKKKYTEQAFTIEEAVGGAFSALEELGQEMRDAFDNTPESLQNSGVGEARGEAADALENIGDVDVPESLRAIELKLTMPIYGTRGPSRAARRDDACIMIDGVIEELDRITDDEKRKELHEDASSLRDDLENMRDDAEGIEFPGMFG